VIPSSSTEVVVKVLVAMITAVGLSALSDSGGFYFPVERCCTYFLLSFATLANTGHCHIETLVNCSSAVRAFALWHHHMDGMVQSFLARL
jgi:hypothetical protein